VKTLFVEPGSSRENGYVENFNSNLRDGLLDREIFDTFLEDNVLVGLWRKACNTVRPHTSLGYRAPAPESCRPCPLGWATLVIGFSPIHRGRSVEIVDGGRKRRCGDCPR
jgi:hypothetical protein